MAVMKFSDDQIIQLKTILNERLKEQLKFELRPIKDELKTIRIEFDQKLKKQLKPIKKDLKDIKTTQNLIIGQFDRRLNHLEKHTTHPPHNVDFASDFTPAFAS